MIFTSYGQQLPKDMAAQAAQIGKELSDLGWTYRGGYEEPGLMTMDIAVNKDSREIFVPWQGFNKGRHKHEGVLVCHCLETHLSAIEMAQQAYPTFKEETTEIQMYWVRNIYLLLGENLDKPTDLVIYYQDGQTTAKTGSQYLLHAALQMEVPCFNIQNQQGMDKLYEYVSNTL